MHRSLRRRCRVGLQDEQHLHRSGLTGLRIRRLRGRRRGDASSSSATDLELSTVPAPFATECAIVAGRMARKPASVGKSARARHLPGAAAMRQRLVVRAMAGLTWIAALGCGGATAGESPPSGGGGIGGGRDSGLGQGGDIGGGGGGASPGAGGANHRDAMAERDPSVPSDAANRRDTNADVPTNPPGCPATAGQGSCSPGTMCRYGDLSCLCWLDAFTPTPTWRCSSPGQDAGPPPTPPKCPEMAPKSFEPCGGQPPCEYADVVCTCVVMDFAYWNCSPKRDR